MYSPSTRLTPRLFAGGDNDSPPSASNQYTFTMCQYPGKPYLNCTIDEMAIFGADLDPGNTTVGSVARRFYEMYRAGVP